jgi:uncharacterized lipoprotein YddW (UPF0748 family)
MWFCAGILTSVMLMGPSFASHPRVAAARLEPAASAVDQTQTVPLISLFDNTDYPQPSAEPSASDDSRPTQDEELQPVEDNLPTLLTNPTPIPPVENVPTQSEPPAAAQPVEDNRPNLLDVPSRAAPLQSIDPADQIAPPGLIVRPGDEPISSLFAYRMEQELNSLVGRYESALFAASAADQPPEVRLPETPTVATPSAEDTLANTGEKSVLMPLEEPSVLQAVRDLKQDWSDLLEQQSYREARSRWLSLRQDLWDDFPLDRQFAQPEIRAMWLDRGSIVAAENRSGLARLFDDMQASGINTVFFETVNAGFPIYRSAIAPQQNPLTLGWDPLADAVELAHERGIELHAWIWAFAAGNLRHNPIIFQSDTYLGPSLRANPDWMAYDQAGSPIPLGQTKPFYDPANPDVRAYLLGLVDEIITQYDVDGLQLDYIRYPFQDPSEGRSYGYGLAARRQFRRQTGVDPVDLSPQYDPWMPRAERERMRSLWEAWEAFRIEQVTSFVKETSELVRQRRPDITLSAAVFAMPEHERLQKIQQDWNTWAEEGLVDWIVLMSYAQDANRFAEMITPWVTDQDYGATLVIPGLRLLNIPVPVMMDQLQTLRDMPALGYALFATDNLDARIQTVLNNTQGAHTDAVIPQATPYATAAKRFHALQREWNWLLANGKMTLQPRLAERWVTEVNAVGASLDDLASGNSQTLETTRTQLADLKRNLGAGLELTTTSPDYRRSSWNYRLEAIDRYLVYGAARTR